MRSLYRDRTRWIVAAALALCAAGARPVQAAPIAGLAFVETSLGGGLFQYDYTLIHLGDPLADLGFDAYDLALFFDASSGLVSSGLPTGWDMISGSGFLDAFSLQPGVAPLGTDVGPGQSLADFRFVFNAQVGSTPFQVAFGNPIDPANPVLYDGLTAPVDPAPVPEPGSLLLLGTGLASLVLARRRTGPTK